MIIDVNVMRDGEVNWTFLCISLQIVPLESVPLDLSGQALRNPSRIWIGQLKSAQDKADAIVLMEGAIVTLILKAVRANG